MSVAQATVTQNVNHPPLKPKYRSPFIVLLLLLLSSSARFPVKSINRPINPSSKRDFGKKKTSRTDHSRLQRSTRLLLLINQTASARAHAPSNPRVRTFTMTEPDIIKTKLAHERSTRPRSATKPYSRGRGGLSLHACIWRLCVSLSSHAYMYVTRTSGHGTARVHAAVRKSRERHFFCHYAYSYLNHHPSERTAYAGSGLTSPRKPRHNAQCSREQCP